MSPQQIESLKIFVNYSHIFFISLGVIKAIEFLMRAFILEEKDVPCWSQIIPFYNEYVWFKAFWKPLYFFIILGEFIFIYVFLPSLTISSCTILKLFCVKNFLNS